MTEREEREPSLLYPERETTCLLFRCMNFARVFVSNLFPFIGRKERDSQERISSPGTSSGITLGVSLIRKSHAIKKNLLMSLSGMVEIPRLIVEGC